MKNTFNEWSKVDQYDLDTVSNLILTGKTAKEALPDKWLNKYLGNPIYSLKILDFGCGMGRNTFELGASFPHWTIVGYDNENMISKVKEYYPIHYSKQVPLNICFISDWDILKHQKFDTIYCCLVLQHIHKDVLSSYISDFKRMTSRLVVSGRRFNDSEHLPSTWKILEDNGLIPNVFLNGDTEITYQSDGLLEDHNTAIYNL